MLTLVSLVAAAQSVDGGLTFREVVADLPTDPASVFVVLLLLGCTALVVWSGRGKGKGGTPA